MSIIETLKDRIRGKDLRILFPEGDDERVLAAVEYLRAENLAKPIILFKNQESLEHSTAIQDGVRLVNVDDPELAGEWATTFRAKNDSMSEKRLLRRFSSPLHAASIILGAGGADAMVAGLESTTEDVILSCLDFVGLQDGISLPSSIFLMRIPDYVGSEGELLIFADCGVVPAPSASDLAQIGLASAKTAADLLGWDPRIAFLSFSTVGSGEHETLDRIRAAVAEARAAAPELKIDGEFQLDAAISPHVAARKVNRPSPVAGRANILIFPDLNAGNIAYKAVQRFAHADAFGPFLQGFAKSVSDLSRGSTVDDVVGVAVMALARAEGAKAAGRGQS